MNICQALRAKHSNRQTIAIIEFIGDDAELMKIFFAGEYRLTQRAA